jgi:N-hydroxyarylamine O-acetyltransferase
MLDVPAYLARIGYSGPTTATADTLRGIHRAHMLNVPFENLDIALGRKIVCEEESFIRKIVDRNRGGFCYEINGAFAALLRALGFNVTLLSARVPCEDGSDGPEFDHLTLRVDLEEPWLADVGFGDCFLEPLRLAVGEEQREGSRTFVITPEKESYHLDRTDPDAVRQRQYSFTLTPRRLEDFAAMCHYHQTSPQSPFTRKRVCSKATADGRITLAEDKLIVTHNGNREERLFSSNEERRLALKQYFNVTL